VSGRSRTTAPSISMHYYAQSIKPPRSLLVTQSLVAAVRPRRLMAHRHSACNVALIDACSRGTPTYDGRSSVRCETHHASTCSAARSISAAPAAALNLPYQDPGINAPLHDPSASLRDACAKSWFTRAFGQVLMSVVPSTTQRSSITLSSLSCHSQLILSLIFSILSGQYATICHFARLLTS